MDIEAIRTFLAICDTGSFQAASERVHVTQSTVSMRVKALEERLRVRLFKRSKSGTLPTVQGQRLQRYARMMVLAWQEGRQQVGIPESFDTLLSIGGQHNLWDTLLMDFLPRLRQRLPRTALRVEAAAPFGLMRRLSEGLIDLAVLYRAESLPGLRVEELLDDQLVLVTTNPSGAFEDRYVHSDWGLEIEDEQRTHVAESGVTVDLGSVSTRFLIVTAGAGYVPHRMALRDLETKRLYLARGAPSFRYPIYVAYHARNSPVSVEGALSELRALAATPSLQFS